MMFRRGFTLIEVNLAMFVMAVGTLGLVSLYTLGYRENQQSGEDVQAAAVADKLLNEMVTALSSTNMTWSAWESIGTVPENGWLKYVNESGSGQTINNDTDMNNSESTFRPVSKGEANSLAKSAYDKAFSAAGYSGSFDYQDMACGIVICQKGPTCSIAVRCARRAATLVYQPLYYTEVYFQGLPKEGGAQ